MKKTITLIGILSVFLLAINISSCNENRGPKAPADSRLVLDSTSQYSDQNYKVYTLEGCEYLVVGYGKERWGSHKGNCKNPIHQGHTDRLDIEDKDYVDPNEKHFDCYAVECTQENDGTYAITTECGILYYSDKPRELNEVLKGFHSPKHK